jgi:hypothetical protein
MIPESRQTLLNLLQEYDASLTRAQGEKDLMKCIEARAVTECGVGLKAFRTVATALWRDQVRRVQEELDAQMTLFAWVMPANERDHKVTLLEGILRQGDDG